MKLDICIYSPYMTKYYILLNNKKLFTSMTFYLTQCYKQK